MTVEEVLKQSGFTDEQIKALDPQAITAFGGVLSTAERERQEAAAAREAAELALRSNRDFYEGTIAPSLNNWSDEKIRLDSELAYYRAQNESLKANGILPADAPGYQPRDTQGRYVPNAPGATPGSPSFNVHEIYERAGNAIGLLADIQYEHQRLFNEPLPVSPSELVRQADAVKLDPKTYAARTFGWDTRRLQLEKEKQEEHDSRIAKETEDRVNRTWAERVGSNPDVRMPQSSRFADLARGVQAGARKDPLLLNEAERRAATRQLIRSELADGNSAA